jgi:hypothetical protein
LLDKLKHIIMAISRDERETERESTHI